MFGWVWVLNACENCFFPRLPESKTQFHLFSTFVVSLRLMRKKRSPDKAIELDWCLDLPHIFTIYEVAWARSINQDPGEGVIISAFEFWISARAHTLTTFSCKFSQSHIHRIPSEIIIIALKYAVNCNGICIFSHISTVPLRPSPRVEDVLVSIVMFANPFAYR